MNAAENQASLQKLFISVKKVIKVISNSPWCADTQPLFRRLNILNIGELHKLHAGWLSYILLN